MTSIRIFIANPDEAANASKVAIGTPRSMSFHPGSGRKTEGMEVASAMRTFCHRFCGRMSADTLLWLNPDVIGGGAVGGSVVTGIGDVARLDEEELHFPFGDGFVLDAIGDDIHFAGCESDGSVPEVNAEGAFEDEKGLVGVGVRVPDEFAFEADDLELVIVHFGNDFGLPLFGEQAKLVGEVNGLVRHGFLPHRAYAAARGGVMLRAKIASGDSIRNTRVAFIDSDTTWQANEMEVAWLLQRTQVL
jgi:hypothetical protein